MASDFQFAESSELTQVPDPEEANEAPLPGGIDPSQFLEQLAGAQRDHAGYPTEGVGEEPSPFERFDPQVREAVDGLIHLGYLETDPIEFAGHTFVLRTLKGDEELAVGRVAGYYIDTPVANKAWIWAHVAMALTEVDGDGAFCPALGPDREEFARARFKYCTQRWHWPLAEYLWVEFARLLQLQADALRAIQDLSERGRLISSPYADSLTEQGTSGEWTSSETPI
jgi:hypothetical protein